MGPALAPAGRRGCVLNAPITWGGLDFDTSEFDTEIRELLGQLAPEGGSLRELKVTARVRDAHRAAIEDANLLRVRRAEALGADPEDVTPEERAIDQMTTCLYWLHAAQSALLEAHEVFRGAQRAAGGSR